MVDLDADLKGYRADQLLQRLRAATGPDRELDAEIAQSLGWECIDNRNRYWRDPDGIDAALPHYTRSVDDALTLVPNGWRWRCAQTSDGFVAFGTFPHTTKQTGGHAPTAALAICIASMEARDV